jgi:hypothetical protein
MKPTTFFGLAVSLASTSAIAEVCTATVHCGPQATASCSVKAISQESYVECGAVVGKAITCKRNFRNSQNNAVTYVCCADSGVAFSTTDPNQALTHCASH